MGEKTAEPNGLDHAEVEGTTRCHNTIRFGTSVLFPPDRDSTWVRQTEEQLRTACPRNELLTYHVELLRRADALLRFMDTNVGYSRDFPIVVRGENSLALDALSRQVEDLRHAVGMMLEF